MKLNRFFVRFNWSESAFQFLVLLYIFCASEAWIIMGLIDWNTSFFKSQQIKQIEVIPHKKLIHRSIAQNNFENWKKKPKNCGSSKNSLKIPSIPIRQMEISIYKSSIIRKLRKLTNKQNKTKRGSKEPISRKFPSYSSQKTKIEFEIP